MTCWKAVKGNCKKNNNNKKWVTHFAICIFGCMLSTIYGHNANMFAPSYPLTLQSNSIVNGLHVHSVATIAVVLDPLYIQTQTRVLAI